MEKAEAAAREREKAIRQKMHKKLLGIITGLVLLMSCSQPATLEKYISSDARTEEGAYRYELDLTDTVSLYSIAFYTLLDEHLANDLAMEVSLYSPSGKAYKEKVTIPAGRFETKGYYAKECFVDYRTDFQPVEYGHWWLELDIMDHPEKLRGMGLRLSKQKQNTSWEKIN